MSLYKVIGWALVGVGAVLGVGSNVLDALQMVSLGLPVSAWTAIAFTIFAAGMVTLIKGFFKYHSAGAVANINPDTALISSEEQANLNSVPIETTSLDIDCVTYFGNIFGIDSCWGLVVSNKGASDAVNCRAFLETVNMYISPAKSSDYQWPKDALLQWETHPKKPQIKSVHIPAKENAVIELAQYRPLDFISTGTSLYLSTYGSGQVRLSFPVPCDSKLLFIVRVEAQNSNAVYALCSIDAAADPNKEITKLLKVQDEYPVMTSYLCSDS